MNLDSAAVARTQSLRQGEKFLRQGLLSRAIAEYDRAVEADPRDFVAAAALGDLLLRAGDIERAIDLYARIADAHHTHGALPTAAALYRRILRLKPNAELVQIKAAEVSVAQGMPAEARKILRAVADRRASDGNRRGTAEVLQRIADLDPEDLGAGLAAALAAGEAGDTVAAGERLVALSTQFRQRGDLAAGLRALDAAVGLAGDNGTINGMMVALCLETGDLDRAARHASNAGDLKTLAAALAAASRPAEALGALRRALECDPVDRETRLQLVRDAIGVGNLDLARECLGGDLDDPGLLLCLAEVEMLSGNLAAVRHVAERLATAGATRRPEMVLLGLRLSASAPDAAFEWIDVVTDQALAERDWSGAAAALLEYVSRVSPHVQALMKLVEVCVDGGLEATLRDAQARLADAYLLAGRAAEARVIAEDLVIREPTHAAHVERFRRALEMLGEPDPDARVAERLNAESLDSLFGDHADAGDQAPPSPGPAGQPDGVPGGVQLGEGQRPRTRAAFDIDLASVFEELEVSGAPDHRAAPLRSHPEPRKTDGRGTKLRASRPSAGGEHYRRAVGLCKAGRAEEAMSALKEALRSPSHRFESATLLAKLHRHRGDLHDAIEWFERAIQAAPDPEATRDVLYELGRALVSAGEGDRALAVFLELRTEAPGYKDVSRQIQHLSRRRAGV